ncbi:ATP synthase subunit b-like protein [Dinothrombium tinctorium]|uniref:ATP synthase subunit b n=1 Tax=Dinothrombium tinctorium TaxID=1965070 RepID=A0A3S3PB59_9ACAR|nr:ATP synthase subunit b-like protein [Dinothrombium tinctorium]RWS06025.1 ATP synthase subunit b-like protein [Dinothrombium tinctorium]
MISRLAYKGDFELNTSNRLLLFAAHSPRQLLSQYKIIYLRKAGQTAVATNQSKEVEIGNDEPKPLGKYSWDDLVRPPPPSAQLNKVTYETLEELKKDDKPVEDLFCTYFGRQMPMITDEFKPERDKVNFPRWVRPIDPPPVRIGFFPDHWFRFFYNKTGVTGPYIFGVGLVTFLFSKEIYVIGHGTISGISLAFWVYVFLKVFGPKISARTEGVIRQEEEEWVDWQQKQIKAVEKYIANNKQSQESLKNQKILFDAKRENIHLQRETEYRRRLMQVFDEAKRKLEYQLAIQEAQKQFSQKHMVNWIIDSVVKGITPDQERAAFSQAVSELKKLSAQRANLI